MFQQTSTGETGLRRVSFTGRNKGEVVPSNGKERAISVGPLVPPERVELSSPAPEAGTLSTELQGHYTAKNSMVAEGPTRMA